MILSGQNINVVVVVLVATVRQRSKYEKTRLTNALTYNPVYAFVLELFDLKINSTLHLCRCKDKAVIDIYVIN